MNTKKESILVVDDEEIIRRLLCQKLTDQGYLCYTAANAEEAISKLNQIPVAMVLLDINMPGKTGVELLPEIRAIYPDTAVVMATAATDFNAAIRCMKEGAYDYLTKPFKLEELVISVARALERRRLLLDNRDYQQHLEQRVAEQTEKIRVSVFQAVTALAFALEAKDKYTSGHSQRVADIASAIARKLGLTEAEVANIKLAGQLHDIGKIGIRGTVLNKSEGLTDEEFKHISSHSEMSEHILSPIIEDKEILKMVRHHHERFDGTGYPDGLRGEKIPLGSRIIAVADTFDAMTSERPYRQAMTTEAALSEIERNSGRQFDSNIVDIFIKFQFVETTYAGGGAIIEAMASGSSRD